jgi:hypothetical protein
VTILTTYCTYTLSSSVGENTTDGFGHSGKTGTGTATPPLTTKSQVDTNGVTKTAVVSGINTIDESRASTVSVGASVVIVTTVTKTNGNVDTVTFTVPCQESTTYTSVGSEGASIITATLSYFPTVDVHGSVVTGKATVTGGESTVGMSTVSNVFSTITYTSNGITETGVVIGETSNGQGATAHSTGYPAAVSTLSTSTSSLSTTPSLTLTMAGSGSRLSRHSVLFTVLSLMVMSFF